MRWDIIAKELRSHRRPISCLQMWQRSLNSPSTSHQWNLLEDKKLMNAVENQVNMNWVEISKKLSSARSPKQCFVRFSRLNVEIGDNKNFSNTNLDKFSK